jgi:hypothetical protein
MSVGKLVHVSLDTVTVSSTLSAPDPSVGAVASAGASWTGPLTSVAVDRGELATTDVPCVEVLMLLVTVSMAKMNRPRSLDAGVYVIAFVPTARQSSGAESAAGHERQA